MELKRTCTCAYQKTRFVHPGILANGKFIDKHDSMKYLQAGNIHNIIFKKIPLEACFIVYLKGKKKLEVELPRMHIPENSLFAIFRHFQSFAEIYNQFKKMKKTATQPTIIIELWQLKEYIRRKNNRNT